MSMSAVHTQRSACRPLSALLTALATLALLGLAEASQAEAGRFQFVHGEVRIVGGDGRERPARRGDDVAEGERVRTGARGSAQLRMVDGAALAVRPGTEVRIDAYRYADTPAQDRSFLSLLRGSLRSITGLIGRRNREGYRVSTPTATIGIRGSDADVGFAPDTGLTAVRTYSGGHSLTALDAGGNAVTLETNPGQIAIALPGQAPSFATAFPFSTPTPPPGAGGEPGDGQPGDAADGGGDRRDSPAAARRQRAGAGAAPPSPPPRRDSGPGPLGSALLGQTIDRQRPVVADGAQIGQANVAAPGTGVVGAFIDAISGQLFGGAGQVRVTGSSDVTLLLGANGAPVAFTDATGAAVGESFNFVAGTAVPVPLVGFEVRDAGGTVTSSGRWGVWQGGYRVFEDGVPTPTVGGFHFAVGNSFTTLAQLAAQGPAGFSYQRIGGIASNETGALASNYVVNVAGTFSGTAALGNINVNIGANFPAGSTNWVLNASGSIAQFADSDGLTLGGSCSGCAAVDGDVNGIFLGAGAEGLISSFGATDSLNGKAIVGTAVGQRGAALPPPP